MRPVAVAPLPARRYLPPSTRERRAAPFRCIGYQSREFWGLCLAQEFVCDGMPSPCFTSSCRCAASARSARSGYFTNGSSLDLSRPPLSETRRHLEDTRRGTCTAAASLSPILGSLLS